jgi:imidazolonepropionase-like amidohydrolase
VRNLGDPCGVVYDLRDAINRGDIDGPRIVATQHQLVVSGGDYDPVRLPVEPRFQAQFDVPGIIDGPLSAARETRREIARGADVIKVRISGVDIAGEALFETEEELRAIVETAHRLKRKVALHAQNARGVLLGVKVGVDSIEHGPLPEELWAKGAPFYFVPTLTAFGILNDRLKQLLGIDLLGPALDGVLGAFRAGVPIAFGTDSGLFEHGRAVEEFDWLVKAGLTPYEALTTATVNAAAAIGLEDKVGRLLPGFSADLVAMSADPTRDVSAVKDLTFVMKEGSVYRHELKL